MSNIYHDSLDKLKPNLPRGYQAKIVERLENISIDQVKKAFRHELKDETKLGQIVGAATNIASEEIKRVRRMKQGVERISRSRKELI